MIAWSLLTLSVSGCIAPGVPDPVSEDVPRGDPPAALWEGAFESDGERLNAIVYQAAGPGPHPVAILLHGFPGNERNLDLAQVMRRGGWTVVFFHYRGAWGSDGAFSFSNAVADVHAVIASVREPTWAASQRIDPDRIALVGHSMGGFLALLAGAENDGVSCIASLAGANLGANARLATTEPVRAQMASTLDEWMSGRIAGTTGAELIDDLVAAGPRMDLSNHVTSLSRRGVLLLAATEDETVPMESLYLPLGEALSSAGAPDLSLRTLVDDHSFSNQRIALSRELWSFLETVCANSQSRR